MSKSRYTAEQRTLAVEEYLNGYKSASDIRKELEIASSSTFREWITFYREHGTSAFSTIKGNKAYPSELKNQAVEEYLEGTASSLQIIAKYNISSRSVLRSWIKKYNSDMELKDYNPKQEVYMAEARGKLEPKYLTIQYFKQKNNWCVSWMCQQLSVSHAGYYKWFHREKTKEELDNEQIALWIKEYDEKFKHTLGFRRMRGFINRDKYKHYSKDRIQRIMCVLVIKSIIRKQRKPYRHSTLETTAGNVLHREFEATKPNEKWATDVTELKIQMSNRKVYLSTILDFYDRSVVSYVLSNRNDNKLVLDTYDLTLATNPDATPLFHSDRGFQYTSKVFQKKLQEQGMIQSMSQVGCCIDNGPTEGFWGIIKSEMYYISHFSTEEDLRQAIIEFIEYYNSGRYQERFNNLTSMEVRNAALQSKQPYQYPIPANKRIQAYKEKLEAKKKKHIV